MRSINMHAHEKKNIQHKIIDWWNDNHHELVKSGYENWSNLGPLLDVVREWGMIDLDIRRHMTVAEAWSGRRQRRHRTEILNRIEEVLMLHKQNRVNEGDKVLWRRVNDTYRDKFLTKDTWKQTRSASNKVVWYEGIWFAHWTPKFSFCAWLAVQNRLSTGDQMFQWNRGLQTTCTLCNNNTKKRYHLFFSCRFVAEGVGKPSKEHLQGKILYRLVSYDCYYFWLLARSNRECHCSIYLPSNGTYHMAWEKRTTTEWTSEPRHPLNQMDRQTS